MRRRACSHCMHSVAECSERPYALGNRTRIHISVRRPRGLMPPGRLTGNEKQRLMPKNHPLTGNLSEMGIELADATINRSNPASRTAAVQEALRQAIIEQRL